MSFSSSTGASEKEAFFREAPTTTTTPTVVATTVATTNIRMAPNNSSATTIPARNVPKLCPAVESSNEQLLDDETKSKPIKHVKRKRRRRKGVHSKQVSKDFKVYLVNIRGANSKKVSLQAIVDDPQVNPDVINLVETNLRKSSKLEINGYKCFNRNRQNKNMGGVATLVKETDMKDTLKVSEGSGENEYLVTRHSQFSIPINIIVVYGEQETRTKAEDIERRWDEVMEEVKKIEARDESCILLGDFNKAVGNIIPENNEKVSFGGDLVRRFLENGRRSTWSRQWWLW